MITDQGTRPGNTSKQGPSSVARPATSQTSKVTPVPLLEVFFARFNERQRLWGIRVGIILVATVWLMLMAATWSQADEPNASPQSTDEYNFKWLDPDKKIYVLQNRRYQKEGRATLSLSGGPDFGNAYRNAWAVTPRLSYFFTEAWGVEFFFSKTFNSPNNTYAALVNTNTNVFPVIRELNSEFGGLLYWSPWYAKINVFNEILYFDWLFGVGAGSLQSNLITNTNGVVTTTSQSQAAFFATTGQQFYLSQKFIIRWDITGTYYSDPVFGTSGKSSLFGDYRFELGLGVRL